MCHPTHRHDQGFCSSLPSFLVIFLVDQLFLFPFSGQNMLLLKPKMGFLDLGLLKFLSEFLSSWVGVVSANGRLSFCLGVGENPTRSGISIICHQNYA